MAQKTWARWEPLLQTPMISKANSTRIGEEKIQRPFSLWANNWDAWATVFAVSAFATKRSFTGSWPGQRRAGPGCLCSLPWGQPRRRSPSVAGAPTQVGATGTPRPQIFCVLGSRAAVAKYRELRSCRFRP